MSELTLVNGLKAQADLIEAETFKNLSLRLYQEVITDVPDTTHMTTKRGFVGLYNFDNTSQIMEFPSFGMANEHFNFLAESLRKENKSFDEDSNPLVFPGDDWLKEEFSATLDGVFKKMFNIGLKNKIIQFHNEGSKLNAIDPEFFESLCQSYLNDGINGDELLIALYSANKVKK